VPTLFRYVARWLIGVSSLGLLLCIIVAGVHFLAPGRLDSLGQCSIVALVFAGMFSMVTLQLYGFRDFSRREAQKLMYVGVPKRLRAAGYGVMAVGAVVFFLSILGEQRHRGGSGSSWQTLSLVGFEAIIAAAGLMLGYSFLHFKEVLAGRRCPAGHPVSAAARFCEVCGGSVP
jgi:hypothetical protein